MLPALLEITNFTDAPWIMIELEEKTPHGHQVMPMGNIFENETEVIARVY